MPYHVRVAVFARPELVWPLVAVAGVQAATIAAVLGLGRREEALRRSLPYLVSAAAGVLLSTACLDLLPEAVRTPGAGPVVWDALLLTMLALFFVQAVAHALAERSLAPASSSGAHGPEPNEGEEAVHLHAHAHVGLPRGEGRRSRSSVTPLLLGSALHSATDGVAIAAAFAAGQRSGWIAAIAVGLHELPHRTGDFALFLHMGLGKRRAAQLAIGAGAAALLGWLGVALMGMHAAHATWLLPVSAGTFLYIALVDLLPELHSRRHGQQTWWQMVCLAAGAAVIALLLQVSGG